MRQKEIEKHKTAAKKLELVKDEAFKFIKKNLGKISEYDVCKFILSEFKKQELISDKKPLVQIVAVNKNSSIVHYYPKKRNSKIIKKESLILIDLWARLKENRSPFADITWMAFAGKNIPKEYQKIFKIVINARNLALDFIKKNLKKGKLPKTRTVDKVVRNYFKKFGLEKNFLHNSGHSLGIKKCHGRYFYFGKKSKAGLKPEIPFTIEPGIYFKNKFGIRSEINCYVTNDYKLVITTRVQNKIIKI